jgi:hypothetical protein
MEGGFFLIQDINVDDPILAKDQGNEYIGHDESKQALTSHNFDNTRSALE